MQSFANNLSECYDWGKTGYLCKHFIAVFEKFPSWSFNGHSFNGHPFLNLDKFLFPLLKENTLPDATPTKNKTKL